MCLEKVHRLMMATLLSVALFFLLSGSGEIAAFIMGFMIFMLTVWALFDFCPAVKILKKFLPTCPNN